MEATPKPGWKSTEFIFTAVTYLLSLLLMSGAIGDGSIWAQLIGALLALLKGLGYDASRASLKGKVASAAAALEAAKTSPLPPPE